MYRDSMTIAKNLLNDDRHKMSQSPQAFTRRQTRDKTTDARQTQDRRTQTRDRRETNARRRETQTDARQTRDRRRRTHSEPLT